MKTEKETKQDELAAIGIGAMIVFIALILVAAVAAAVIIQTAEKLQQNAQASGDDTQEQMSTKLTLINVVIETRDLGAMLHLAARLTTLTSCLSRLTWHRVLNQHRLMT